MKFNVYKQGKPIPTGERTFSGSQSIEWHRANLVKVGEASNWDEAKQLCRAPILGERIA